jgi:hypothetical protein
VILFLDIDGVINSLAWDRVRPRGGRRLDVKDPNGIDPTPTKLIGRYIRKHDLTLVVSSSWRKIVPRHTLQDYFAHRGITTPITDYTPVLQMSYERHPPDNFGRRGAEIYRWLIEHYPDTWRDQHVAILDDDCDMGAMSPAHVRTRYTHGLQRHHLSKLTDTLSKPLSAHGVDRWEGVEWYEVRYPRGR